MPQNKISICMSVSFGLRLAIVVEAGFEIALAAEYTLALKVDSSSLMHLS